MTVRQALGLLAIAIVGAAVLNAAGTALPAPPLAEPGRLAGWWTQQGTAAATLSVARLGAMACCFYLFLIGLLGTVAGLTRWRWSQTLTKWIATPALRRMIAGGSLAAVMTSTQAVAAAPALHSVIDLGEVQADSLHHSPTAIAAAHALRAGYSITDLGAVAARVDHHSVADIGAAPSHPGRFSVTDLGVAHREPVDHPAAHVGNHAPNTADPDAAAHTDSGAGTTTSNPTSTHDDPHPTTSNPTSTNNDPHPTTSNPTSTNNDPHPTTSNPTSTNNDPHPTTSNPTGTDDSSRPGGFDTWLVEPGDHLWGIAAATVAERGGSDDPAAVARYWLKLIEANTDTVGDKPDLVYPGQLIRLPR